jgi:hypothetical protein
VKNIKFPKTELIIHNCLKKGILLSTNTAQSGLLTFAENRSTDFLKSSSAIPKNK